MKVNPVVKLKPNQQAKNKPVVKKIFYFILWLGNTKHHNSILYRLNHNMTWTGQTYQNIFLTRTFDVRTIMLFSFCLNLEIVWIKTHYTFEKKIPTNGQSSWIWIFNTCKFALINEINLKLQGNLNVFIPFPMHTINTIFSNIIHNLTYQRSTTLGCKVVKVISFLWVKERRLVGWHYIKPNIVASVFVKSKLMH